MMPNLLLLLSLVLFFLLSQISHGDPLSDTPENSSSVSQRKKQLSFIDYSLYHKSDLLLQKVKELVDRHPDRIQLNYLSSNADEYSAEIPVVTYAASNHQKKDNHKFRVLLSFGQHGRELITSEVALQLLKVLAREHHLSMLSNVSLSKVFDHIIVKVVPLENLNGRRRVEEGKLCERKNGRGVDINRNWGVDWGKKEKDYDPSEEFPGVAPFSEPETRIMQKLAYTFKPHLWVNVHSGMEALFMPYDHKNSTPDGVSARVMMSLLKKLNHLYCKNSCVVGSGGGSVGYFAHGTATDYMYDVVRVPMAFTFEIYGDQNASSDDCFRMFNPLSSSEFERVLDNWSAAFIKMLTLLPRHLGSLPSIEFGKIEADGVLNQRTRSSKFLDFPINRKVRSSKNFFVIERGKTVEWDIELLKGKSWVIFLSSFILLFLLYWKTLKHTKINILPPQVWISRNKKLECPKGST